VLHSPACRPAGGTPAHQARAHLAASWHEAARAGHAHEPQLRAVQAHAHGEQRAGHAQGNKCGRERACKGQQQHRPAGQVASQQAACASIAAQSGQPLPLSTISVQSSISSSSTPRPSAPLLTWGHPLVCLLLLEAARKPSIHQRAGSMQHARHAHQRRGRQLAVQGRRRLLLDCHRRRCCCCCCRRGRRCCSCCCRVAVGACHGR